MSISQFQLDAILARMAHNKAVRDGGPGPESEPEAREDRFHEKILEECAARGWLCFHGSMKHRTHRTVGEPDFVILLPGGRTLLVEAKSKHGKMRPEQLAIQRMAARLGHRYIVAKTVDDVLTAANSYEPCPENKLLSSAIQTD